MDHLLLLALKFKSRWSFYREKKMVYSSIQECPYVGYLNNAPSLSLYQNIPPVMYKTDYPFTVNHTRKKTKPTRYKKDFRGLFAYHPFASRCCNICLFRG